MTRFSFKGGVQEVVFSHSNQRVVGGSRAEELISRAAVRDVFERKMYSQLPANNLVGTQEVSAVNGNELKLIFRLLVCLPESQLLLLGGSNRESWLKIRFKCLKLD